MQYQAVTTALLAKVPEFEPFYAGLMCSFGGEDGLGAHVVVGGLFTFLKEQLRTSSSAEPLLVKVLDFVEDLAASPDTEVQNLAVISFLEHLWQLSEAEQAAIVRRLGPASVHFLRQHNLP